MKIAFAGTPEFAARALGALIAGRHETALVLTQPDRPAGRGQKLQPSPVKVLALAHGIPVDQPPTLREAAARASLAAAAPDVLVVAAYGLILPQEVLDIPRLGCLNIHASLLPRWRGAAPIQRAIEAGDAETGITIMRMDAGLDTGPMLLRAAVPIGPAETGGTLHDRLADVGARLVVEALDRLPDLPAMPQPAEGVTYAKKIGKAEGLLDWGRPAAELERRIRAFDPFPGCSTGSGETQVKIWAARASRTAEGAGAPGTLLAADSGGIVVATGDGLLVVTELQKPGGRRLPAADFLRGFPLSPGDRFTPVESAPATRI
ncbi:MAG: methionyl-tRNA formyltransferase [Rhodocyclaceae bacterium]|nr:methionyl-tRNA formyltransferase [Rhodocyclaceae bacterium]